MRKTTLNLKNKIISIHYENWSKDSIERTLHCFNYRTDDIILIRIHLVLNLAYTCNTYQNIYVINRLINDQLGFVQLEFKDNVKIFIILFYRRKRVWNRRQLFPDLYQRKRHVQVRMRTWILERPSGSH